MIIATNYKHKQKHKYEVEKSSNTIELNKIFSHSKKGLLYIFTDTYLITEIDNGFSN